MTDELTTPDAYRLLAAIVDRAEKDAVGQGKAREIEKHSMEARRWLSRHAPEALCERVDAARGLL